MKNLSFNEFTKELNHVWGGLNTETIEKSRNLLSDFAGSKAAELAINKAMNENEKGAILYSDEEKGFRLLVHKERKGLYRIPHNHGSGWVSYAVHSGEIEMATYGLFTDKTGDSSLVSRGLYRMKPGDCTAFLPGDIHDTRCISENLTMLRLTSWDLDKEKIEGRMVMFKKNSRT